VPDEPYGCSSLCGIWLLIGPGAAVDHVGAWRVLALASGWPGGLAACAPVLRASHGLASGDGWQYRHRRRRPAGIFVLYNAWDLYSDPYIHAWAAQNLIHSPNPVHYLLAYGLLLPFAALGRMAPAAHSGLGGLAAGRLGAAFPCAGLCPGRFAAPPDRGGMDCLGHPGDGSAGQPAAACSSHPSPVVTLPMWLLFPRHGAAPGR